ncbi:MAG: MotA/TolQ/ExbB proton channel family protein [Gammaproteobacteria bacterium]|nr:MotA/TolQ/ExbB proton channel family protein [Gammaproteobacteria bacterium]
MLPDFVTDPLGSLGDMRELGGPVVMWIFAACIAMWTIVLERIWYFRVVLPQDRARLLVQWEQRTDRQTWASRQIRTAMISQLNEGMTRNLHLLRVLVPMCPLLGLIGTVIGMLSVFDSMAALGSADARSMATGVSEAMVCTLMGLAVSISGLYPVYYFRRTAHMQTEKLADRFGF